MKSTINDLDIMSNWNRTQSVLEKDKRIQMR